MSTKTEEDKCVQYLAFIPTSFGGSWAQEPSISDAVRRCCWFYREDWGRLFDVKGKEVKVYVCEVQKDQTVIMSPVKGFTDGETGKEIEILETQTVRI